MKDVRARIVVSGEVQGVGYRDLVKEAAFNLRLKGTIRNRPDERVEITAEGQKATIEKFAKEINVWQYPIGVESVGIEYSKATGEFKRFTIEWEEKLDAINAERLATSARLLRTMNDSLGSKMDKMSESLGTKMDKNLHATQSVGGKIDLMRTEVAGSFTRMEEKYGEIGRNLNEAVRLLARAVDKFEKRGG
jgi:acylphosphatase